MTLPHDRIPLVEIQDARHRIEEFILRTPMVRLNVDSGSAEIYLKLENLQQIGSFKVRGAANAMALCNADELTDGVYTASAGNMAQGLAFVAARNGVRCCVVVPDHAPETKLHAIERFGAEIIKVPFDDWWNVIVTHQFEGLNGKFIHPVTDPAVIAGNGTIGIEVLEDLPDVDAIVIPYGGGGLSCGIASAVRTLKPETKIYAAEVETAAPLAASLAANHPCDINYTPSFVDGIGGKCVLPQMWSLAQKLIDTSLVVSLQQTADAIRLLAERNHTVSEGAGAVSVAAALAGLAGVGKIVCIVSGGNIDPDKLSLILNGKIPC